jgi:hypothetical protein
MNEPKGSTDKPCKTKAAKNAAPKKKPATKKPAPKKPFNPQAGDLVQVRGSKWLPDGVYTLVASAALSRIPYLISGLWIEKNCVFPCKPTRCPAKHKKVYEALKAGEWGCQHDIVYRLVSALVGFDFTKVTQ